MSFDVDPIRVGPKRRRVDSLGVGLIVVVLALGLAIAKPWEAGPSQGGPPAALAVASSSSAVAPPSPASSTTTRRARVLSPDPGAAPPTWADIGSSIDTYDTWGVRAIFGGGQIGTSVSGAPPRYLERWSGATPNADGVDTVSVDTASINGEDQALVAVGLSFPPNDVPLGARIWRVHSGDELEWIDADPIDAANVDGALIFIRPGVAGSPFEAWQPGHYRIDVLTGKRIRQIAVEVPDGSGTVPPPDDWTLARRGITPTSSSEPPAVFNGMFAFVDGFGKSLRAQPHLLLDERESWLDLATAGGVVASVYLPRTSALGVMLPSGASVEDATMRRLASDKRFDPPPPGRGNSDRRGRSPFVMFEAPAGTVWAPGVYAISLDWTLGGSARRETWHVELRPGAG